MRTCADPENPVGGNVQMATRRRDVTDITELLSKEETRRSSVELPVSMWSRLEEIAAGTYKTSSKRYTRDEIIQHFLRWALEEWDTKKRRR
jgi:hypothetical protein